MQNFDVNPVNLRRCFDYCVRKGWNPENLIIKTNEVYVFYKEFNKELKETVLDTQKLFLSYVCFLQKKFSEYIDDNCKERIRRIEDSIDNNKSVSILKRQMRRAIVHVADNVIDKCLESFCNSLETEKSHSWYIKESLVKGKRVYSVSGFDFLLSRLLQESIKTTYQLKISNRHQIVEQIKSFLLGNLPLGILRTDIHNFYENVDFDLLISRLKADGLLPMSQIKLIESLRSDYKTKSRNSRGIPRGIGLSAYLAELYLREVDKAIKEMKDVVFYGRFVDDIVVITMEDNENDQQHIGEVYKTLEKRCKSIKLEIHNQNSPKTKILSSQRISFDYLGYHFEKEPNRDLKIGVSEDKLERIKTKIDFSLRTFYNKKYNSENAVSLQDRFTSLYLRLKAISGSVVITGAHKKIIIGFNQTYPLINEEESIKQLNLFLNSFIGSQVSNIIDSCQFSMGNDTNTISMNYKKYKKLASIWRGL